MVDLERRPGAQGRSQYSDGIEIGAMTTLTEVVQPPARPAEIRLPGAGGRSGGVAADPQPGHASAATSRRTRAAGITAAGWPCYRAGGNICYADTPTARNREHAILHAERCVAVNPSDTAPALIALDAKIRASHGEGRAGDQTPKTTSSARTSTSRA